MRMVEFRRAFFFGSLLVLGMSAYSGEPLMGTVRDECPKIPLAPARAASSFVASDGSVYLAGSFTSINGTNCPGVARLRPDGSLDSSFLAEGIPGLPEPILGIILIASSLADPLYVSQHNQLMISGSFGVIGYTDCGLIDSRFDSLGSTNSSARSVFEYNGRFYLLASVGERRVSVYDAETFEPIEQADSSLWPASARGVVPAQNGKLWVLGFVQANDFSSTYTLFRIHADGSLDSSFVPREFSGDIWTSYQLSARELGGFALLKTRMDTNTYGPTCPTYVYRTFELFDTAGNKQWEVRATTTGWIPTSSFVEEPSGSVLYDKGSGVARRLPDGTDDLGFSSLPSGMVNHIFADGRIQHNHIHQYQSDGSVHTNWTVPLLRAEPRVSLIGQLNDGRFVVRGSGSSGRPSFYLLDQNLEQVQPISFPEEISNSISVIKLTLDREKFWVGVSDAYTFDDETQSRLLLMAPDGTICPDSPRFIPHAGAFITGGGEVVPMPSEGSFSFRPLADGKILIEYSYPAGDIYRGVCFRILSDGMKDPAFVQLSGYNLRSVFLLRDGRFVTGSSLYSADGVLEKQLPFEDSFQLRTELDNGNVFLSFYQTNSMSHFLWQPDTDECILVDWPSDPEPIFCGVYPLPEGDFAALANSAVPGVGQQIMLFRKDGSRDPAFQSPIALRAIPECSGLASIRSGTNWVDATRANRSSLGTYSGLMYWPQQNALVASGDFTHLNGKLRNGMAALSLRVPGNYEEWLLCTAPSDIDPDSDQDRDGLSTLAEYLLGTDPAVVDAQRLVEIDASVSPPRFCLPKRSPALDLNITFECSTNLVDWHSVSEMHCTTNQHGHILYQSPSFSNSSAVFSRILIQK